MSAFGHKADIARWPQCPLVTIADIDGIQIPQCSDLLLILGVLSFRSAGGTPTRFRTFQVCPKDLASRSVAR